jgi:hypothetical protein
MRPDLNSLSIADTALAERLKARGWQAAQET